MKLGLALLALALAQPAWACECIPPPPTSNEGFNQISLVFKGRLLSSRTLQSERGLTIVRSRWAVSESIKGLELREVEIDSPFGGSARCGLDLHPGMRVTLAARGSLRQGFHTDSCTWGRSEWPRLPPYRAERQKLKEQLRQHPHDQGLLLTQGQLFQDAGEFDDAIKSWSAVLNLDPKHAQARLARAQALRAVGDSDAARKDEDAAARLSPVKRN
ncbi:tetratricopeptide repeat protein [Paucibacter sp. AS339]|uniref:tetratricopeptide repeat protein n=1 Tax=Paucibacter hankyongi TaxID=3133434 RepID=UPI00309830AA